MPEKKILAVVGATGAQGGGLARAVLADPSGEFALRAITRDLAGAEARALADQGAEVVAADADDPASLDGAFAGAYGAFCVTSFWEHVSPERELAQAAALARATRRAGLQHVVWSTLEDTRRWIPLDDPRLPTLMGHYKVPHFDAKGEADAIFAGEGAPTTYLLPASDWENMIHAGTGPRMNPDGTLVLTLPLAGAALPGIAADDIGHCAYGIFKRGTSTVRARFGIAGDILSGSEMAAALAHHLGRPVLFYDMPFDDYRALGFPGVDDVANMFRFQAILGDAFLRARSPETARSLYPKVQSFDTWLTANAGRIPIA